MGYIRSNVDPVRLKEAFRAYCIRHGFNECNCVRPDPDGTYKELYEEFRERVKSKRFSYEAYVFSYYAGGELQKRADEICRLTWMPEGYKAFLTYHPTRVINAPSYADRIVESWYTKKFIEPYFSDRLLPENMACQTDKGPDRLLEMIVFRLHELYEVYGTNFWYWQYDMAGFYDNLGHDWVKKCFEGIHPYAYFLISNTIDSWAETEEESEKYYCEGKTPGKLYGFPKGNLPSQWAGVISLDEHDRLLKSQPGNLGEWRYMDDGLDFFETKEQCRNCMDVSEKYLSEHDIGVRLHPKKTHYAPISQGFNFCGWHISMGEDGSIVKTIQQDRKALKKKQIKGKQKAYRKGHLSWEEIDTSIQGTFAHWHKGDCRNFEKYVINNYRFAKPDEDGDLQMKKLQDRVRYRRK